jgi:tryptophan synthase alpha subunit
VGGHPYPYIVRELQAVIGREARAQMLERTSFLPEVVIACVGGGSNAIGLFHAFLADAQVALVGIEAGGRGAALGENSATLGLGRPGVLHGSYSMLLQDEHGQIQETHSISAGLDYPGVGPEHALLRHIGRVDYQSASDAEALAAVRELCEQEGILPALESAHALAGARRWAAHPRCDADGCRLVHSGQGKCMSERTRTGAPSAPPTAAPTPAARIEQALRAAAAHGTPALVAYMTAGFPSREGFREQLAAIASAADVVEVGVPFTDPMADGVTIQRASEQALRAGVTLSWILQELNACAPLATPLLLMSYLNPLLSYGLPRLASDAAAAGVCGFIVPDLPHDESEEFSGALASSGLALVQMVTPVTTPERLARVAAASQGFVYAVTMTGTTGRTSGAAADLAEYLGRVRAAARVPVCAGFGIRSRAQVQALAGMVDGVVIGSALLELLERGESAPQWLRALRPTP